MFGLKKAITGDTLCSPEHPLLLEKMEFPEPVISMAIEPKSKADREKLSNALVLFRKKIRPSALQPTKKPVRQLLQVWVSSTLKFCTIE